VKKQAAVTKPWIILVGGFLGSGKTTLLIAAAQELERRGLRTAITLNDQGDALVDSHYVMRTGLDFGEVTGGCFCCKLSDLVDQIDRLKEHAPDVIFAEPVGSCTDLSATVLHPLAEHSDQYWLAPLTVLVDPSRAISLLDKSADLDLSYLFHKQIEEADLVCFSKSDLYTNYPTLPDRTESGTRQLSAKSGQGVSA
jgi:G3E family GTPase